MSFGLTTCFVEQVGDGTLIQRATPVPVVGLGSGIANIALGGVRRCRCVVAWVLVVLVSGGTRHDAFRAGDWMI